MNDNKFQAKRALALLMATYYRTRAFVSLDAKQKVLFS